MSVALGIIGGVGANLGGWNVLISFFSIIPTWLGSYKLAESTRNALAIDCTDYVEELPLEKKYIPLKDRTKTLTDIRDLDSTRSRESAERIKDQIVKEKIAVQILDEFLE